MKTLSIRRFAFILFALMTFAFFGCGSSSDTVSDIIDEVAPAANVRVIHLSPDTPEVDVDFELIEVEQTIVGLEYKEASPYTETSTVIEEVVFKRGSDDQELGRLEDPGFASDVDNTVYAVNLAAALEFIQSDDDRSSDANKAKVRVVHAAPDVPAIDVNIKTADQEVLKLFGIFKDITDYALIDPGEYFLVVIEVGNNSTDELTFGPVSLEAGNVYTAVALGTEDDSDAYDLGVRVFKDSGSGNTFVDLASGP